MKRIIFILFALSCTALTSAQKRVRKAVLNPEIHTVYINASQVFSLELSTNKSDELVVEAELEGEYQTALNISMLEKGSTLEIGTNYQPDFKDPNDKLSAHKVISIKMKVQIPSLRYVIVNGLNTDVRATGRYSKLTVTLNDGNCVLEDIGASVRVHTRSGSISASIKDGEVMAESAYGTVKEEPIPAGTAKLYLESVTGDISIERIYKP